MMHDPHPPVPGTEPEILLPDWVRRNTTMWPASVNAAEHDVDRVWTKVEARMEGTPEVSAPMGARVRVKGIHKRGAIWGSMTIAALALAVFMIGRGMNAPRQEQLAHREYTTQRRQHAAFELPDGSNVVLAPESKLAYTQERNGARVVALTGQAVFTVVHNRNRSFTVETGTIRTRVLGTTFQVQYYPEDVGVEVRVTSGKVVSSGRRSSVVLTPGTVGYLTDSTATATETRDVGASLAWTSGRLVFQEIPVKTVLQTVGRWYGYTFLLTDSTLATQRVTTTLLIDQPTEGIQMLKTLLRVDMVFDGDTVTLRPLTKRSMPVRRYADPAPTRTITAIHAEARR